MMAKFTDAYVPLDLSELIRTSIWMHMSAEGENIP